jgi:ABC-2 type transport system permease protein
VWVAVQKEFRQIGRDPVLLVLILWLYTVEGAMCASSLSFDLRNEPIGVLDLDRSRSSWRLADQLDRTASFAVRLRPSAEGEARELIEQGETRLILVIPRGYEERLARTGQSEVQFLVDGSNSIMALTALGQARRVLARSWREILRATGVSLVEMPVIENRVRVWYNPELRFAFEVVLNMIAIAAFMVAVIIPAALIVKEKESGTIEQVLVTPMTAGELMAAKTIPMFVLGLLALGPAVLMARLFGVPLRGNPGTLLVMSGALLVAATGTGVLIAALVRTTQQALLAAFFALFPVLFLSGTITPVESMPRVFRALSLVSPLRYYAESLPAIFLKGAGLGVLWPKLLVMLGVGGVLFGLSALLFRRRLT